jgi:TM2 domain-containing membrane protein YozV
MPDLAQFEEPLPAEPSELGSRRSPELALLLSLLFPGLGHIYVGKTRSGFTIIAFESLALLGVFYASGDLHGNFILAAPILYCFAMADAYFAARERNAGVDDLLVGTNPRIVAVLNLLTKGFGYFYLGDRLKGAACFVVCSAIQAAILIHLTVWTSILAISLQVVIALDGYRVARQRLLAAYPELAPATDPAQDIVGRANPGGLPPTAATSIFLVVGTLFLIGYSVLRVLTGHFITQGGSLERGPSGLAYNNPTERVAITAPETWNSNSTPQSLIMLEGDGVNCILLDQYSMYAAQSSLDADRKAVFGKHPDANFAENRVFLSNHMAKVLDSDFTNDAGKHLFQRFIYIRRGLKLFMVVETWTDPAQRPILDRIEKSLTL